MSLDTMNVLYKYYSSNFNLIEHINKPSIKLSHTASFNDPFERILSVKLAEQLTEHLISKSIIKNEYKNNFKESFKQEFMNSPKEYGVVSLTETHRNILMWAHYANSHRGVCIGYKSDFLSSKIELHNEDLYSKFLDMTPQRVRYDSQRFDIEKYNHDQTYNNRPIHHIVNSMTLKSNDWMYEKEHRCIAPFRYGEYIKLTTEPTRALSRALNRLQESGLITKTGNTLEYEISRNNKIGKQHNFNIKLGEIAKHSSAMILKEINRDKIHSIHFGCQFDNNQRKRVERYIKMNQNIFGHIKLYRYDVNPQSFDIVEYAIN